MKTFVNSNVKTNNIFNLFNILNQVAMPLGAVYKEKERAYEATIYSVIYSLAERKLYIKKFNYLDTMMINIDSYIINKDGKDIIKYFI